MKKLAWLVIVLSLGFIFVNQVEATPLKGIQIEVCKSGIFSKLFGKCFVYTVEDSYASSSIWCYSTNRVDGWACTDNNKNYFEIPYTSVTIRNLNNADYKIIKHTFEYGNPWSYTEILQPDKTAFLFNKTYHAFSINFEYDN
jgi:hypothetical protein